MEWVKLVASPAYYLDAALLRAGEAAEVLFCRGLAHCGAVESEGRIDKALLPMLVQARVQARAASLVREGLWLDMGDHYIVRSWAKWQDEHDVAAHRRKLDRERQREKRRKTRTDEDTSRDAVGGLSRDGHDDGHVTKRDCHAVDVEVDVKKDKSSPSRDTTAPDPPTDLGTRMLTALVEDHGALPRDIKRRIGGEIDKLLTDQVNPDAIWDALTRWAAMPDRRPGLLPFLVRDPPTRSNIDPTDEWRLG